MGNFTKLDIFWAAAFLLLLVGGAFFFYRLARRSESDFFLAGRGLPWWLPASSVFSTHTATDTPIWITGVLYKHGLSGLWYTFVTAWTAIGAFVSARIFRRSLAYTQAEWQTQRFSGLGAEMLRGWMAGWQVFMNMFILGWVGIAMGQVCELAFGWPVWVGLVFPSVITAVYTLAAGYWGVVMGDFLQGIVAVFAIVLITVVALAAGGGATAVTDRVIALGQEAQLSVLHFTEDLTVAWWLTMLVTAVLGGFGMCTAIDWFVEAQRIQSARSLRDATYGLWAGGAVTLIRNGFWAAAIIAFFANYSEIIGFFTGGGGEFDPSLGWFLMGFELLPVGLVGVFFGAILAIHLSTISSHLNLGALYFTRDIYQRYLKPDADPKELVTLGRWATFVLLIGSFFYGLMMEDITKWLIFALWLMNAGIWLPNILQVVWWRFNAWGYLAGWIANLGMSWLVVWVLPYFNVYEPLPEHITFWLLIALGALIFLPVTFLTRAEPMDHLVKYYVMTRPLGWWGPVHREAVKRGLITETPKKEKATRPFIKRQWTAEEAGDWTREDWIAIVLSPMVMAALMIGVAKTLLLQPGGFLLLAGSIAGAALIYWVIDPKLSAVSVEYEAQQEQYVQELEDKLRWQTDPQEEGGA
jgi:SSS family solute:Na+ symporter